ncbi:M48 family metalloprotease, partial [bacterium]|nr:M48 family metalloprotease [bacterium]
MDLEQLSIVTTWNPSGTNLAVALLHTLWEGVLLAGMLFLMLITIPAKHPRFRYALSLLSLLALVCTFYGTYTILEFEERVAAAAKPAEEVSVINQPVIAALSAPKTWLHRIGEANPATPSPATSGFSIPWMQGFLWFWFAGVVCMLTRFFFQVKSAQQLHRSCSRVNNVELGRRLERLQERLRVFQTIPLYIHNTLTSPVTTGIFKPVILLPAHIVTGSPMEYIEAILAHELAHIRRKDYLVNLLQMLVEAFFFFNPAVWWISRQIRLEREACCDAMAVGATGERMAYANALASIPQQKAGRWLPEAAPAFGDSKQSSNLLNRIRRLAIPQHRPAPVFSWTGLACFLLCSVMVVACFEKSTDVVADAATQWILSEEQIEEMADIDKSYGKPKSYQVERDEGKKVEVKGTVTTFDGKPLPKHTHVMIHSSSYNSSANYGVSISAKDNQFSYNVQYGRIYISVAVDGYAAAIVGPLDPGKNGTVPAQDIILQQGVPAKLRLVNQEKQPIPDAEVEAVNWVENFSFSKWLHLKSDENGIVTIENYNGHKMRIRARAAGYQFQQEYFVLP